MISFRISVAVIVAILGISMFGTLVIFRDATPMVRSAGAATQAGGGTRSQGQTASSRPIDQMAPFQYRQAMRNGRQPHPTITAHQGRFSAAASATYPDGVTIRMLRIAPGVENGRGAGVFPGRADTALSLSLSNRSVHAINLNQVVVTTMYGSPAQTAPPVYDDSLARDFNGIVQPGGSVSATYVFAIPHGQAREVVTIVDFDDVHVPATFTGSTQ